MVFTFEKSGQLKPLTKNELEEADKGLPIVVCNRGVSSDGKPYWLYLAIKPSRYSEYQRVYNAKEPIVFEKYGAILRYGFDEEVPKAIKEKMREKYGCDENFMATLEEQIKEERATFMKDEDKRIDGIVAMMKNKTP